MMKMMFISLVALLLGACSEKDDSPSSPPSIPIKTPAVVLISADTGADKLGAIYSIEIDDMSKQSVLYEASGGHDPHTNERDFHNGLIYSDPLSCGNGGGDGKFWGIVDSHYFSAGENNTDIHLKIFPIYYKNWLFNNADYER